MYKIELFYRKSEFYLIYDNVSCNYLCSMCMCAHDVSNNVYRARKYDNVAINYLSSMCAHYNNNNENNFNNFENNNNFNNNFQNNNFENNNLDDKK